MITVQAAFFDRNGSAISGIECSATSGEIANIDGEVVVTFTSTDAGRVVRCHTRMYTPSGQQELNNGQITVPSNGGTFSFIGNMSTFVNTYGIGNYNIANVNLFDMNTGIDLFNGNPGGGGNCTSLIVTGGGGGLGSISIPSTKSVVKNNSGIITATCKDTTGTGMTCPTLTWSASNNNVMLTPWSNNVDCTITGVNVGTSVVTVIGGGKFSNNCTVTITSPGCTSPKYKCYGTPPTCISDNCDRTGTFFDSNCGTGCGSGGETHLECDSTTNKCVSKDGSGDNKNGCASVGQSCKPCSDPLNIGCTSGIPNTYLLGAGLLLIMMMKK